MNEHLSSQQLSDLVEGLLPPDHVRAVQAHLVACAGCRQALAQRRALVERLRREVPACLAQVTPPPTLRWENARRRVPFKQRSLEMLRYVRAATVSVAVLCLFVVLALGLNDLFRQASSPDQSDGHEVLAEETVDVSDPQDSFFEPITPGLQTDLPPVVGELPLYLVEPALPEMSVQEVRLWAERLDMGPVRVYRTDLLVGLDLNFYVGMNADWDSLTLHSSGLSFASEYSSQLEGLSGDWTGERVDEAVAQAAAQAFLERLAPYLMTVEGTQTQISFSLMLKKATDHPQIGYRWYDIVPRLDGVPLMVQGGLQNSICVGPEGRVNAVNFTPLRVSLAGEIVNPRPAEEALRDLFDGKSELFSRSHWNPWESLAENQVFERSWPQVHRKGDKITVIGNVQWMYGLEGEDDLVLLRNDDSVPHTFILEGDDLNLLAQPQPGVQVWGTLVDYPTPLMARLQVERIETTGFPSSGRWEGHVRWRDGSLWIETASGQEFILPDPPPGLPDSAHVMLIAAPAYDDSQHLEWTRIFTIPAADEAESGPIHLMSVEFDAEGLPLVTDRSLNLTVWWMEQEPDLADYVLFVHLVDVESGQVVAQHDVAPDRVVEVDPVFSEPLELALDNAPPGKYRLAIGFYDQSTNERLPLWGYDFDPTPDRQLLLPGVIQVRPEGIVYPGSAPLDTTARTIELAYYVELSSSQEQPALTEPVYLSEIYSADEGYQSWVYVSAVDTALARQSPPPTPLPSATPQSTPLALPKIDRHTIAVNRPAETMTSPPSYDPNSNDSWQMDLRNRDLSTLDLSVSLDDLLYAVFDERTVWPSADRMPQGFDWQHIMELGKNPGLGVRDLHAQGITGRGVSIAIIDQPLLTQHREYADRLQLYEEINVESARSTMHGTAVASIAVGKTTGVAPEADLYFIGSRPGDYEERPEGYYNFVYYAQAIRRILEINNQLPQEQKIRVISMQIGWNPDQAGYDEITAAVQEAKAAGMLIVCSSIEDETIHGFRFNGLGRAPLADPDSFESYEPGLFWAKYPLDDEWAQGRLLVPMDSRTTASFLGDDEYVFYRRGGWSWSIPYIAGMYALAAQVDPAITPERFWSLAMQTGRTIELEHNGEMISLGPIIDAVALIDALRGE